MSDLAVTLEPAPAGCAVADKGCIQPVEYIGTLAYCMCGDRAYRDVDQAHVDTGCSFEPDSCEVRLCRAHAAAVRSWASLSAMRGADQ